jgi:antibiotic biosynthesis monooxygenase (ABM) superfamily enzyme
MMLLQIYFDVAPERCDDFEEMYREVYVPALQVQRGYLRSNLLRVFPPAIAGEIDASPTEYNYTMELVFDTEANRRRWVASPEHQAAFPVASSLARAVAWRGYDIVGYDG